jgi:F-type H+-transporting ATPase subunit a
VSLLLAAEAAAEEGGLKFPSIDNLVEWPSAHESFFFNKVSLVFVLAVVLTTLFFVLANKKQLVPKGIQNLGESAVNFIDEGIIQQTIGHGGEKYLPYLVAIFFFVLFGNIFEIIPVIAMPANARMAGPLPLALITWGFFICVGVKNQGPLYFWKACKPAGVPLPMLFLIMPIEFISIFIIRPFSLTVRLFANMLAGHILLVTFSVLTIALVGAASVALKAIFVLPFVMLVLFTGFEILVSVLQAYVFAILAAVYIGEAAHPAH